ncbi:calcium/sodium antiporter [Methanobrevibacter sp. TMH8]|uniref:calcium/sodium antiporter n=1 Tax=Methanobrevibacter sp. TMH8 TaxID=2848611 RepID=UPI001CCD9244|nr:calcium/sodium antiporter [Methanobrevibacter sp. TMH8]MBZ9570299.1 calcium/sodium antiporter [Methanobrevibacter sp. TMH8]
MLEIIGMCLILVVSLFIVIKAADLFVDNIVEIGTALGISQILLGVTAAAIGTSLPEFGSALIASLGGNAEMGVGVVIGSNIWNVAGILGITATVTGLVQADKKSINRDGLMAIITGLVLVVFMIYGFFTGEYQISGIGSIVMIIFYIYYMRVLIKDQKKDIKDIKDNKEKIAKEKGIIKEKTENIPKIEEINGNKKPIRKKSILFIVAGIVGLAIGCQLMIMSAESLATTFGIPEAIMGLFTLSIGTSIPELVVTLSSAMKGLHDISMGTVFGSVTFNILIGIGVPALLVSVPIEPLSLYFDAPIMIGVIALTLLMMRFNGMKLNRYSGIFLIVFYALYAFLRIFVLS